MNEILELVKAYQNAIHTQKKEDFISLWTNDESNVLISIDHPYVGVNHIYQDFLMDGIQKTYSDIQLIAEDIQIRFVNEDIAIVVFQYHTECIRRDTNEEYGIAGVETQVVKRVNGKWKLVHIHYSKK